MMKFMKLFTFLPVLALISTQAFAMKRLKFGANECGINGCTALAKNLSSNQTLQVLYLNANPIGSKGANALAAGLRFNISLKVCHLDEVDFDELYDENDIEDFNAITKAVEEIDHQVEMNKQLSTTFSSMGHKFKKLIVGNTDPNSFFFILPRELVKSIIDFAVHRTIYEAKKA